MTIDQIKNYENAYCKVTGYYYLDSMTMAKTINGGITVKGEYVVVSDENGFEIEVHYEEIKEIDVL